MESHEIALAARHLRDDPWVRLVLAERERARERLRGANPSSLRLARKPSTSGTPMPS